MLANFTVCHLGVPDFPKIYLNAVPQEFRDNLCIKTVASALEIYSFSVIVSIGFFKFSLSYCYFTTFSHSCKFPN